MLSLLAAMPSTLRSVELRFLVVLGEGSNYRDLLTNVCNTICWRERTANQRPKIKIHVGDWYNASLLQIWSDKEANRSLYKDGENPLSEMTAGPGSSIPFDQEGVQR